MKAVEELLSGGIERCPECNCPVGDDWDYKDFSSKTIAVCPQCGEEIYLDNWEQKEAVKMEISESVEHLVNAGYVRQALEKSGADISKEEIDWIIEAVDMRLKRYNKKKKGGIK